MFQFKKTSILILAITAIVLNTECKRKYPRFQISELDTTTAYTKSFSPQLGETMLSFLLRSGISENLAYEMIQLFRETGFNFKRIRPTDTLRIFFKDARFEKIEYQQDFTNIYCFDLLTSESLKISFLYRPISKKVSVVKGVIKSSLYESMLNIGEKPSLILNFADVLSCEIDFFTETQSGDSFFVLVEKKYCNDQFIDYGQIYAVRYKGQIGDVTGFYFCDSSGHKDFYNYEGKSLRKSFLKSPLRYSYISSYFSRARFHPVLKIIRPHRGVDYVAPEGTPVSAIGDGVISFIGWKGGYGRFIEIRHKGNFTSRYGHLRAFARGLKIGTRVSIGQVIGYLGSTGLTTGPHLHFELLRNGKWVNPLRVIIPRADPVKARYLNTFVAIRDSFRKLLYE
ncbi:MAG: M23 family metallopeptidase [candidate division WOR-3 bacterium]|nr:M23 family metallopeptidase [candidate division WOR-3 bacterium]